MIYVTTAIEPYSRRQSNNTTDVTFNSKMHYGHITEVYQQLETVIILPLAFAS